MGKTISAEHVLAALEKLGYGDFRKDAEEVLGEHKEMAAKRRRQSTRLENLGIPEEELLRQQQELFARARQAAVIEEQQQQLQLQQQQQQQSPGVLSESITANDSARAAATAAGGPVPITKPGLNRDWHG